MEVHPDCGIVTGFVKTPSGVLPIDSVFDIAGLFRRMSSIRRARLPQIVAVLWLAVLVCRSVRRGQVLRAVRAAWGLLCGRGGHGLCGVSIEQFADSSFQDVLRLKRCATALRIPGGINQCGCFANRADGRVVEEERV